MRFPDRFFDVRIIHSPLVSSCGILQTWIFSKERFMKYVAGFLIICFAAGLFLLGQEAQGQGKYSIGEVMKIAFKGGLFKKVAEGDASVEENNKLIDLFKSMLQETPPQGDVQQWKAKTAALLGYAQRTALGNRQAANALLKAGGACKSCHDVHKN